MPLANSHNHDRAEYILSMSQAKYHESDDWIPFLRPLLHPSVTGCLRSDGVPGTFAERFCHFFQTLQPITAETGPFIGSIVDVAQCVTYVLIAIVFQAFLEQLGEFRNELPVASFVVPVSNHGSGTEAGERGHDNKERSEPVPHPENVAGFANKPPPEHPTGQQQKENGSQN